MNTEISTQRGFSLEEITMLKHTLKKEIPQQRQLVVRMYRQLLNPFSRTQSTSNFIGGRLLNGFTVLDSAIWGFRIISRIFRFFRRRR